MNVVIDWGNTRVKLGLFEGQVLRGEETLDVEAENSFEIFQNLLEKWSPSAVMYASSGAITPEVEELLQKWKAIPFTHQTPVAHSTVYTTRPTLGLDRILCTEAAYYEFPNANCLVIDMGTCITYDILDANGVHRGGGISPGWRMRLKAMHNQTARLPLVDAVKVDLEGLSTTEAMQSGAFFGMQAEINGTIAEYERRYSQLNVIVTGGDANAFGIQAKKDIFARPNYTLHGLNAILQHYAK